MNQFQFSAKSFSRVVCLMIMFLSVILFSVNSTVAQSTDIDNPTRLTSNEISGSFDNDNQGENYFYSFTAGSGELVVTFNLKSPNGWNTTQYSVAILDENSKEIGSKFVTASGGNSEQQVLRVNIPRKQIVMLRIRVLAIIGGGSATYRIRLSGVAGGGSNSSSGGTDVVGSTNSSGCLPKQGTLIIRMKDGSKKIIDLSEAETINVVP